MIERTTIQEEGEGDICINRENHNTRRGGRVISNNNRDNYNASPA